MFMLLLKAIKSDNLRVRVNYPLLTICPIPYLLVMENKTHVLGLIFFLKVYKYLDFTFCHKPTFSLNTYKRSVYICVSVSTHIFV